MAKKQTVTEYMNNASFRIWQNRLKAILLNLFEWLGLPEGIEEEYIEEALYENGKALFFEDKNVGLMCLPAYPGRGINVYKRPVRFRAVGFNYSKEYDADECVLIKNDKQMTSLSEIVDYFAYRLTEVDRTADVNVKAVKTPYILSCNDRNVLTLKAIFNKIDSNEPAIFTDKDIDLESIKVLETHTDFLGADLSDYQKSIMNDFLTFFGINNTATEKKERLITSEANSNNQLISNFADVMLSTRQKAAEEINAMFGLNVSVDFRVKCEEVHEDDVEQDESDSVSDN